MKIAIDARQLRSSTGRYVERLLHYLQQIDGHNDYVVLLTSKDFAGWQPTSPRFTKLECPFKEFTFSEQLGMLKQIKNIGADLVHFPLVQQPILYRGRVVTTVQDLTTCRFRNPSKNWLVFTIKQTVYKFVNKYVARKSQRLITPSEFVKLDIMDFAHIGPEKITVTLESADAIPDPPTPLPDLQNKKFIMYVGRPQPHKNLWRLVEAFQQLQTTFPDLHLVLGGKKDVLYERLAARVEQAGIKNVVFPGFVSEGELKWLYENTAAYVFPSLSEGFGLPPLEAMKHGAPVVSSNATCLPEIQGGAAHYFDPLDPNDIAAKVSDVLRDKTLRQKLIAAGRQQVKKYSWKRMAEQTLAVYERALKD